MITKLLVPNDLFVKVKSRIIRRITSPGSWKLAAASWKLLPLVLVLVTEVPWSWVAAPTSLNIRGEDVIMKQFAARAAPTFRLQMGRVNKHVWFYDVATLYPLLARVRVWTHLLCGRVRTQPSKEFK